VRIIVTGGTGFLGSNLVKNLLVSGHDVVTTGREKENRNKANLICYDFNDIPWEFYKDLDCLFHYAACTDTTITDEDYLFNVNTYKPIELFKRAIDNGCKRIIYASSASVYGDIEPPFREDGDTKPLNSYAKSKLCLDKEVEKLAKGVTIIGLRYTNVYGSGERHKKRSASMISRIFWQMKYNKRPHLFRDGEQKRDWVYIKDVMEANMAALTLGNSGVYNIGSGVGVSFNKLVKIWNELLGKKIKSRYIENPYKGKYQDITVADISKAGRYLLYQPHFQVEVGMKDYLYEIGW
jgi:ADP-L-glycero-D-manno-heptose 6-epimerase